MEHLHLHFDFLGGEKEKILKEIRTYHTKLIYGRDGPPAEKWDYCKYPPVITLEKLEKFNAPFSSTVTLSANFMKKVENAVSPLEV